MRKSLTIKYNSTRAGSITTAPDKLPTAETAATPQLLCSGGRKDYKQKKKEEKKKTVTAVEQRPGHAVGGLVDLVLVKTSPAWANCQAANKQPSALITLACPFLCLSAVC